MIHKASNKLLFFHASRVGLNQLHVNFHVIEWVWVGTTRSIIYSPSNKKKEAESGNWKKRNNEGIIIKAFVFMWERKLKDEIFSDGFHCFRLCSCLKQGKELKDFLLLSFYFIPFIIFTEEILLINRTIASFTQMKSQIAKLNGWFVINQTFPSAMTTVFDKLCSCQTLSCEWKSINVNTSCQNWSYSFRGSIIIIFFINETCKNKNTFIFHYNFYFH